MPQTTWQDQTPVRKKTAEALGSMCSTGAAAVPTATSTTAAATALLATQQPEAPNTCHHATQAQHQPQPEKLHTQLYPQTSHRRLITHAHTQHELRPVIKSSAAHNSNSNLSRQVCSTHINANNALFKLQPKGATKQTNTAREGSHLA